MRKTINTQIYPKIACIAGGIVGERDNILGAAPFIASGEAARNTKVLLSSPFSSRLRRLLLAAPLSKPYSVRLKYRQLRRLTQKSPNIYKTAQNIDTYNCIMNREICDCLKRERDICVKTIIPSKNAAFRLTSALIHLANSANRASRNRTWSKNKYIPWPTTI